MSTGNTPHAAVDPNQPQHHYAHHFESAVHEYETSKQGVWTFLCTEIVMFGGLFVGYAFFHHLYPELFKQGSKYLDWRLGALNTVVLLTSSLTMALGIYYAQRREKNKSVLMLALTLVCGCIFLGVKYMEYSHKIHEGLLPGSWFHGEIGPDQVKNLPLYFSFYFMMTGLHGIHVLIGMGLILWVLIRTNRGEFGPDYYTPVEGVGLFWHLVDLVWIYLFPLLYLVS
jgi:cytochrome c oxidase subunit 3